MTSTTSRKLRNLEIDVMTHLSKLLDLDPCDPPYILILELEKKKDFIQPNLVLVHYVFKTFNYFVKFESRDDIVCLR